MAKIINISPAEEIIIRDAENERELCGVFNMKCIFIFQNQLSEMGIGTKDIDNIDILALCLYSTINAYKENEIEYKEAELMSKKMSPASGSEIIKLFNESIIGSMDKKQQELLKKTMARITLNLTRQ